MIRVPAELPTACTLRYSLQAKAACDDRALTHGYEPSDLAHRICTFLRLFEANKDP